MKYRKIPVVIEAVQLRCDNIQEVYSFIHPDDKFSMPKCSKGIDAWEEYQNTVLKEGMSLFTLESGKGQQIASMNDWIIKGVKGEYYPCKPDIFEITYENA